MPEISFTEAIRQATRQAMQNDPRVHVLGLGVTYRNGADGTTGGLAEEFRGRVHDTPCSEAAVTGMCVGMAAAGLRPVVHHGRVEFALFAGDALLTQAANWESMFGGNYPVPLVARIAVGRQWGNGSQHTRSVRGMFAVPGLKVVVPSSPRMAKGLLLSAIQDNNPVIFLEHRWLYKTKGDVPEGFAAAPLHRAQIVRHGADVTIVAVAEMVLEALRAADKLAPQEVSAEVIDLVSAHPIDYETIAQSVRRTGRLVIADVTTPEFSVCRDIAAVIPNMARMIGGRQPSLVTCPSLPCPTAPSLSANYYPTAHNIVAAVSSQLGIDLCRPPARSFQELHLPPTDTL